MKKKKQKHFPNNKQVTLTVNWKWSKRKKIKIKQQDFHNLNPFPAEEVPGAFSLWSRNGIYCQIGQYTRKAQATYFKSRPSTL